MKELKTRLPEPTKDANGYPSDESLEIIKKWDLLKYPVSYLLDFVEPLWEYDDRFVRTARTLYLSTGGWSGNEDIIASLHGNFLFWAMYWKRSERGGHYWFDRRMVQKDGKTFISPKVRLK